LRRKVAFRWSIESLSLIEQVDGGALCIRIHVTANDLVEQLDAKNVSFVSVSRS
jgi:hypothetical protein